MLIKSSYGFTLLEVLMVLAIFSILSLIIIPISFNKLEISQENKFIETFEYDLLYTQSLAVTSKERVRIIFYKSSYQIVKGEQDSLLSVRNIPKNINVNTRLRNIISFDRNGRIRDLQKGKIEIETKHSKYHVIFPLGKGRCSIVKL